MKVKYELLYNLHKDYKVYLGEFISNYVPNIGDIVNINGDPFVVYRVSAAMGDDAIQQTYIYISVFKAGTFELEIGGTKY